MNDPQHTYVCPKCGCTQFEHDQFQATGGNFAKIFDIQNKKFHHHQLRAVRVYGTLPRRYRQRLEYTGLPHGQLGRAGNVDRERYDLLDAYMRKRMRGADGAHDCEHVYRVLGVALDIAASEPEADMDVVIAACLLHDIARRDQTAR